MTFWLKKLSALSGLSTEVVQNLVLSSIVLCVYFVFALFIRPSIQKRLGTLRKKDLFRDVVPPLVRLLVLGVLLRIWLAGKGSLAAFLSVDPEIMNKVISSVFIYLFYYGMKLIAEAFSAIRYSNDSEKQFSFLRSIKVALGILCFLLLIRVWVATGADLSTYLGLLSAGLAIALQDPIVSAVGWVYMMIVRPFSIGDRVEIGDHKGDIVDIKLFHFSILETGEWVGADQPTGRILLFPNSFVFKNVIANYHGGFEYIFSEMPIMLTFESDWKKGAKILESVLESEVGRENSSAAFQIRKASAGMKLHFKHLDPKVIVSVADSGVVLTLRFMCEIRNRRFLESKIWEKVLNLFADEPSIDFAYPTQRYYVNHLEGKPEAGGPNNEMSKTLNGH